MSAIALENKTILVTGAAGFIGSNLVKRICEEVPSAKVVGIDSVNDYYDVALKEFRLNRRADRISRKAGKRRLLYLWNGRKLRLFIRQLCTR